MPLDPSRTKSHWIPRVILDCLSPDIKPNTSMLVRVAVDSFGRETGRYARKAKELCLEKALYQDIAVEDIEGFFGKYEQLWGDLTCDWRERSARGRPPGKGNAAWRTAGIDSDSFYALKEYAFVHWLRNPHHVHNDSKWLEKAISVIQEQEYRHSNLSVLLLRFPRAVFVSASGKRWSWRQIRMAKECVIESTFASSRDISTLPIADCSVHREARRVERSGSALLRQVMTPLVLIARRGTTIFGVLPWSSNTLAVFHKTPESLNNAGVSYLAERLASEGTLREYYGIERLAGEEAFIFCQGQESWYLEAPLLRRLSGDSSVEVLFFGVDDETEDPPPYLVGEMKAAIEMLSSPLSLRRANRGPMVTESRLRYVPRVQIDDPSSIFLGEGNGPDSIEDWRLALSRV